MCGANDAVRGRTVAEIPAPDEHAFAGSVVVEVDGKRCGAAGRIWREASDRRQRRHIVLRRSGVTSASVANRQLDREKLRAAWLGVSMFRVLLRAGGSITEVPFARCDVTDGLLAELIVLRPTF